MKKQRVTTLCLCLILLFTLSLCGCQKPQSTPTKTDTPVTETSSQTEPIGDEGAETVLYQQFVNQLNDPDDTQYYVHDIDGNGIKELLLLKRGTDLTIYQYQEGASQPVEVMNQDFLTGTLRLLLSDQPEDYPGLFVFTVG